jgi:hypothetical protein
MNESQRDEFAAHLHKVAKSLHEHVDSVRIICTISCPDGTSQMIARGAGNWYAQFGSCKEWIAREEEKTRVDERKEAEDGSEPV